MPTAYIFLRLRDRNNTKPEITIYQPGRQLPRVHVPYWRRVSGLLSGQSEEVEVNIGTKKDCIQECKGLFWSREAAEAAAQDSCLEYLAEKYIHEKRIDIGWRKNVFTDTAELKETAYARTFSLALGTWKNFWVIVEVDAVVGDMGVEALPE